MIEEKLGLEATKKHLTIMKDDEGPTIPFTYAST